MPTPADFSGTVEAIHLVDTCGGEPRAVDAAEAIAGLGLAGDRYVVQAERAGGMVSPDKQLTLIGVEAIEDARDRSGVEIPSGASRRNVTVRGVPLNDLVGRTFRIGGVRLKGIEPCDPCGYLEKTSGLAGVTRALVDQGGLRAEVLAGGPIRIGDAVGPDHD